MCVSLPGAMFYWIRSVSRVHEKLCTAYILLLCAERTSPHDMLDKLQEGNIWVVNNVPPVLFNESFLFRLCSSSLL